MPTTAAHPLQPNAATVGPGLAEADSELLCASLFRAADFETIAPLLHNCPVRELGEDEILIAAGRPNRYMYVVLSGTLSVRLSKRDSAPIIEIGAGEVVGELSTIDRQPTSAYVVAAGPARVLEIDEDLLWILVNTSHAVATNLLYTLTRRLRSGNALIFEHHERLEQYEYHATVDGLTGLFNRHWLSNMLPRQIHRSRTCSEPLSLLMLDVDEFKAYNDVHGHIAGDAALRAVGTALRESLRPTDMAARYGGEEFLVLLPGCAVDPAGTVAERVREAIAARPVSLEGGLALPGVTVSIGIAELQESGTVEAFVSAADQALYRAKRAGRDRVAS